MDGTIENGGARLTEGRRANGIVTFRGVAILTTTSCRSCLRGPFSAPVSTLVRVSGASPEITVMAFPPLILGPYDVFEGETNTTTITLVGGGRGRFDSRDGAVTLPAIFQLDHSIDPLEEEEDSSLSLVLTTGAAGVLRGIPYQPYARRVTMVGTGACAGGLLGGATAILTLSGTLSDPRRMPKKSVPDLFSDARQKM